MSFSASPGGFDRRRNGRRVSVGSSGSLNVLQCELARRAAKLVAGVQTKHSLAHVAKK
jgi:hypothetical protein